MTPSKLRSWRGASPLGDVAVVCLGALLVLGSGDKAMAVDSVEAAIPSGDLSAAGQESTYEYNPAGKRDPFRPLALERKPTLESNEPLSPLQAYDLSQLKLVGIVYSVTPPRAMVEDSAGLGFIVTPGTPVGQNGGVVMAIKPRQVVVEEWYTDVIGEKHRREVVLELPADKDETRPGDRRP